MLNKITKNMVNIILSIILLASFILVGTPIKNNTLILNLCIIGIGAVFGIYIAIKKGQIINSKFDVIVLFMYITPLIPIIFNTYGNLEETLISLVRNISLFNIYLIMKNSLCKDKDSEELFINILLTGLVILTLLGFDEMLGKTMFRYMRFIGIPNVVNYEQRMFSTLGYANSFAILMVAGIFLSLRKINNNKLHYVSMMYVFMMALLLTYSRSVLVLFILILSVYLFFSKERIYELTLILLNLIFAILGIKLFNLFLESKYYLFSWLSVIGTAGIVWIIASKLEKLKAKFIKINLKMCICLVIGILAVVVIGYVIGLQIDTPLRIFLQGQDSDEFRYKLYNIESETEYNFELDIISKTFSKNDDTYLVEITEENKYYDTINTHKISFGEFEGNKNISLKTGKDTVAMVIFFKSNSDTEQNGLTINSLKINGKKKGLNYLYLPITLVEKVESFTTKNKSVWERMVYFKDALKIIKKHPLTGNGAKGWQYNYTEVQDYVYGAIEPHSYILGQIIDNGMLAGISLVVVLGYAVYVMIKKRKISEIDVAFILLNVHSMMDFNMSFYVISVVWVCLLALITKREKQENIDKKLTVNINRIIAICFAILNISVLILGIVTYKMTDEKETLVATSKKYIKEEKYDEALSNIMLLNNDKKYSGYIYEIIQKLDYNKLNNNSLECIYTNLANRKFKVNAGYNMSLNRMIDDIILNLTNKEMARKFAKKIIDTNDNIISSIKNKEANRLDDSVVQMLLAEQERIYINAKNIIME